MQRNLAVGVVLCLVAIGTFGLGGCTAPYKANVTNTRSVPGIEVQVQDAGGAFWQVIAKNNTSEVARLVWDESTYVSTTGESDRLIRGKTRLIHSGQAQPASPIAPGSELREVCVRESAAEYPQFAGSPADATKPARIILTFEVNGRKQLYECSILFTKGQ